MADDLATRTGAALAALTPPGRPVLVAVSGGPDSVALLELLTRSTTVHGRELVVGHVDHGIAVGSDRVAEQVASLAESHGIRFLGHTLALGAGASETNARRVRRTALLSMADEADASVIALAHHADDQVETILMRVLRGSGQAGLAGMAPRAGRWVRPLLSVPAAELRRIARDAVLQTWEDPANRDARHLRSWLRQEVLPTLERRLPDLHPRLLALGRQAAATRVALDAMPELVPELELRTTQDELSVAAPPLRGYRSELRRVLLASLGRRFGVHLGARRAVAIERLLASERSGQIIRIDPRLQAELAGERLILRRPVSERPAATELPSAGVVTFGPWTVECAEATTVRPSRSGSMSWFTTGPLTLRAWQPGDRIRPLGGTGTRAVSVVLREEGVPRGQRAGWPVITGPVEGDATILWVPGICRSADRVPTEGTEGRRVECHLA